MSEHVHAAQQSAVETEETTEEKLYWAVYTVLERTGDRTPDADSEVNQAEFDRLVQELSGDNVTVRGVYDVSGMRDNADLMVWLTGDQPDVLQEAVRKIRRQPLLGGTRQVWNAMGVHRDAEFTRNHAPSYARGIAPEKWVRVPVRALLRVVLHELRAPRRNAQEPRHEGSRLPAGTRQHHCVLRAQ